MWMASGGGEDTPGFVPRFGRKILEGSPEVSSLLDAKKLREAFPDGPPNYVRMKFYRYKFTGFARRDGDGGGWWRRELVQTGKPVGRADLGEPCVSCLHVWRICYHCGGMWDLRVPSMTTGAWRNNRPLVTMHD